jgi:hypothetical protein
MAVCFYTFRLKRSQCLVLPSYSFFFHPPSNSLFFGRPSNSLFPTGLDVAGEHAVLG